MRVSDEELEQMIGHLSDEDYDFVPLSRLPGLLPALRELQRVRDAVKQHTLIVDELDKEDRTYFAGGYRTALRRIRTAMEADDGK